MSDELLGSVFLTHGLMEVILANTDKFDMIAENYDSPERIEVARVSAEAIRETLLNVEKTMGTAMDFGCGTGLVGLALSDLFETMVFLDTSERMLDVVKHKVKHTGIQNAKFVKLDLETRGEENLESDMKIDVLFMAQVLLHIPDYRALLEKLYNVLNKAGKLVIVDFDKNEKIKSDLVHNGFDQAELSEILKNIGFNKVTSRTFHSGERLFMKEDASMFVMMGVKA